MNHIYHIPFSVNDWIYPALVLAGLFLLALTILLKRKILVIPACMFILAGAIMDHDVTVLVGGVACAAILWFCFKP